MIVLAKHLWKQLKVKWKNAIQRRGKIVKQQTINIVPRYQDSWDDSTAFWSVANIIYPKNFFLTFKSRWKAESQSEKRATLSMTKWKLPTKNRIKTKHLIIYHPHQNRQVDQVFHVDQLPDERAIPKEDQDMKFLYDLLSKVNC